MEVEMVLGERRVPLRITSVRLELGPSVEAISVEAIGEAMQSLHSAIATSHEQLLASMRACVFPSVSVPDDEGRADLARVLDQCEPYEILAVRDAVRAGEFRGDHTHYCLFGIIARCRKTTYHDLSLRSSHGFGMSPIERWVMPIECGHIPANNERARTFDAWLTAYLEGRTLESPSAPPMTLAELLGQPDLLEGPAPRLYRPRPAPPLNDAPWAATPWIADRRTLIHELEECDGTR